VTEYVYLIRPVRNDLINSMSEEEAEIIDRHFLYLKNLLSEDKLIMAGPCLDGAFGIVVFRAASMDSAQKMMENDPAVVAGIMEPELHPYRVSLLGKLTK
jgi:uncharacterized protein